MTTAHTATPIKTTPNGLTIVTDSHIGSQRFIATAENKKDAARIVAAWNAHDDLVKKAIALCSEFQDMAELLASMGKLPTSVGRDNNALVEMRATIAKATGGA